MHRILVLYSPFETEEQVSERWGEFIEALMHQQGENLHTPQYWNQAEPLQQMLSSLEESPLGTIVIMGSGGTERLAHIVAETTGSPLLIVCQGQKNSLAAALEAHAVIRRTHSAMLIYIDNLAEALRKVNIFIRSTTALGKINKSRFGLVGGASPWLLTSDGVTRFGKFTTTLVKISIETLLQEFRKVDPLEAQEMGSTLQEEYGETLVSHQALTDSAKATLAMQQVIDKYKLDGITIRCFDLLPHKFTACMGMSLCADKGFVATCEGDLHAAFSMLLGQLLSGQSVWMANPSSLDLENNTVTFAHCTVPAAMLQSKKQSSLTTHMESGLSTAISGPMQLQEVTVFRSGDNFDHIHAVTGQIIKTNLQDTHLCRTQAVVKLHSTVDHWIEMTPGNHQVIAYGNLISQLHDFCRIAGIRLTL